MATPFGTLHLATDFLHPRGLKIQAAANLNNLTLEVPQKFVSGTTNRTPEFLSKFPHGKVPALATPSGFNLAESSAIAQYVAESGPLKEQLLGRTAEERALVQMWISFSDMELASNTSTTILAILGHSKYMPEVGDAKEAEFWHAVKRLELHLAQPGKKWLVNDDAGVSLADLSVAGTLCWPLMLFMDKDTMKEYPKIMEWWERVMAVEGVGKVFRTPVPFCTKRPPLDGSAKNESMAKVVSK